MTERSDPRILARPEHPISRQDISTEALKVLYRLHRSGYLAYLVGGSVRDLMLGRTPKDFDVATNARPNEVRRLFRNSRIIGRRFRLAHVFFRDEVIEVATFRASPEPPEGPDDWEEAEQEAMEEASEDAARGSPPRDPGLYGTPDEDARRRDFTVNALFYNIADFSVVDYVHGLEDLQAGVVRTIGDPDVRFEEDPVRMMRALEYRVRLGFELEEETRSAIERCRSSIENASPARLSYELYESLRSGSAAGIYDAWRGAGIFELAFPGLACGRAETRTVLERIDRATADGARIADASLIGAFFLARYYDILRPMTSDDRRIDNVELLRRLKGLLEPTAAEMHLTNQTVHLLHQGLFTLTKLGRAPERGRQVLKLARQSYFPVAWELFGFAAAAGLADRGAHDAWKRAVERVRRGAAVDEIVGGSGPSAERSRKRRRPRRRRRR
jgi:poly(A) polymerase